MSADFEDWTAGITIVTGAIPVGADFPDWTEAMAVTTGSVGGTLVGETNTGNSNTSLGNNALGITVVGDDDTTGAFSDTAVGDGALASESVAGGSNTAIGSGAMAAAIGATGNVAIGVIAAEQASGLSDSVVIGNEAAEQVVSGSTGCIFIGNKAFANLFTVSPGGAITDTILIGDQAGFQANNYSHGTGVGGFVKVGTYGTAVGWSSWANGDNLSGQYSTAIGALTYAPGNGTVSVGCDSSGSGTGPGNGGDNTIALGTNNHRVALGGQGTAGGSPGSPADFKGGAGMMVWMANCQGAPTSNPVGGGILYVQAGALMYRGSSGTVTTVAPA